MSIEKNLARIADALEQIVSKSLAAVELETAGAAIAVATEAVKQPVDVPPPPATDVPPPPAPAVTITMEELNNSLVAELSRLGDRAKVDTVMREQFKVTSLTELDESRYGDLLQAVKEVEV